MLMREYETLYILRPDLADDAITKVNERLTSVLDREGAKVLRLDVWGKKKLAYEVKKNPKGVYVHLAYLGQPKLVNEFERNLRMIESVIKYQTIKIAEDVDVDSRLAAQETENRARAAAAAQKAAEMQARAQALAAESPADKDALETGTHPAEALGEHAEEEPGRAAVDDNDEWEED